MSATKNITKPATSPVLLDLLVKVTEAKRTTAPAINATSIYLNRLVDMDLIKIVGTQVHTDENGQPKRGRPMNVYAATSKGRARAKRQAAKGPVVIPARKPRRPNAPKGTATPAQVLAHIDAVLAAS